MKNPEKMTQELKKYLEENALNETNTSEIFYQLFENGRIDLLKEFIQLGVDVLSPDFTGTPPIWHAVELLKKDPKKMKEAIEILYTAGANINCFKEFEGSLLHFAVSKLTPAAVAILCECGADVNSKKAGRGMQYTPLDLAMARIEGYDKTGVQQKIHILFEHGAKGEKTSDSVVPQRLHFNKLYLDLFQKIQEEHKKAKDKGKPLFILLGEGHASKQSLIMEIMIIHIAKKLGIENILFEENEVMFNSRSQNHGKLGPKFRDFPILNSDAIFSVAEKNGLKAIPMDIDHGKSTTIRDIGMASVIKKLNAPAIGIVGAGHMEGLIENHGIREQYHILAIDTYPDLLDRIEDPKKSKESYSIYRHEPSKVSRFDMDANPELMSFEQLHQMLEDIFKDEQKLIMEAQADKAHSTPRVPQPPK